LYHTPSLEAGVVVLAQASTHFIQRTGHQHTVLEAPAAMEISAWCDASNPQNVRVDVTLIVEIKEGGDSLVVNDLWGEGRGKCE
jgi:hypothetical protein